MIVLCFPLAVENPYPVRTAIGAPLPYEHVMLVRTGVGAMSAVSLRHALQTNTSTPSLIVEYGGAGVSDPSLQGTLFEATPLISPHPSEQPVSLKKRTNLPSLPLRTLDTPYEAGRNISNASPRLFTLETWHLFTVASQEEIPFLSLRIATDSGEPDARQRFTQVLQQHRKQITTVLKMLI